MEPIQTTQLNFFERINQWIEESITVKLLSIGFLVLILLIPSAWIQDLIQERQSRADGVMQEVSSKWSGSQTLSGPILVIPHKVREKIDKGKDGIEIREYIQKYYFLPENLDVTGEVTPEVLHRGIFDVAVYNSSLDIKSVFKQPDFASLNIAENDVLWKDAYMVFSITELRGINGNLIFNVGDSSKATEPSNNLGVFVDKISRQRDEIYLNSASDDNTGYSSCGVVAKLGWKSAEDFTNSTQIKLSLKGSQRLNFVPSGKTTTVNLSGAWNDPSFDGEFLPESREITEAGFKASWKVLHYNRPFSQQWNTDDEKLSGSDFGVKLLVPVDQYQKSIRTSKYGQLIIILTFVALFLVEITRKIRIHPFQYILIGVALIIYYTLLLSLSEQVGYNIAYWISSLSTVALISFYSTSFLKSKGLIALFTTLLIIFYSFIFIIILQQDFSLLLGSIGLFMIVGALMYFSKNIKWYAESRSVQP
jgi:inner membrane protein